MRVYETTTHVGNDGRLRLDLPVDEKGQDVHVAVVVEAQPKAGSSSVMDQHARLRSTGISVPEPGSWSRRKRARLAVTGPLVSQTLVEDRR